MPKIEIKQINFYYLALSIFSLIGLYARFNGISIWPLADDEYHTVESVRKILEHGFPLFECDGIYARGILYQYFLATLNLIFSGNEALIYRSANGVISLLALPAIYMIARRFISKEAAIICLMIYMTSVWEVEYARYIRMYMPFQVLFIWYIHFLLEVTTSNNISKLKYLLAISAASVLVYEEGLFITALNLLVIIFLYRTNYKNPKLWVFSTASLIIFVFSFLYLRVDFRHIFIENYLPPDVGELSHNHNAISHGPFQLPYTLINYVFHYHYWAAAGILLFGTCTTAFLWISNHYRSPQLLALSFFILLFSIFNVFTLLTVAIISFYFLGWLKFDKPAKPVIFYTIGTASAFCIYWLAFILNTDVLLMMHGDGAAINFKKALVTLFKYPNYYDQVIYPWVSAQPIITLIIGGIVSTGIILDYLYKRESSIFINQSIIIILAISTMVAVAVQQYHNSRYTFLIYPLLIVITVYFLSSIISRLNLKKYGSITLLIASLSLIFISDDHDLHHLVNINTHDINYRTDMSDERRFHLRNKMDFRSPALHINSQIMTSDIIITSVRPVHHYLERIDYYYINRKNNEFKNVSACNDTREFWTNAKLVSSDAMLFDLINNRKSRVWLILKSGEFPFPSYAEEIFYTEFKDNITFRSDDANIIVYKFNDILPAEKDSNK